MRVEVWVAVAAATLALALASPDRRSDTDFEFDEAPCESHQQEAQTPRPRRPRRYIYDPQNPLCRELICKKREVCLLRDAFTAQCATKKDVLRRGDTIVTARREHGDADDDVFYEAAPDRPQRLDRPNPTDNEADVDSDADLDLDADNEVDRHLDHSLDRPPERCVGCGAVGSVGAGSLFVCGSDNRTYSSLCRLDLHNCVRRASVRLACRGFCPCRAPPRRPTPRRTSLRRCRNRGVGGCRGAGRPSATRPAARGGERCELERLADRLLDWFSVLMEEAGGIAPPLQGFPRDCKPEVRWMFSHLDAGNDGLLSHDDLYALRHDERERCLRPFLASCARGGGGGGVGGVGGLTRTAWCGCLRRAARPCAALARAHPKPSPGAYVPACDARGFYLPRQCHLALGVCWCVDAHGVERPSSRTKGQPACPDEREREDGEGLEGPADDEDEVGSGDNELHF